MGHESGVDDWQADFSLRAFPHGTSHRGDWETNRRRAPMVDKGEVTPASVARSAIGVCRVRLYHIHRRLFPSPPRFCGHEGYIHIPRLAGVRDTVCTRMRQVLRKVLRENKCSACRGYTYGRAALFLYN